MILIAMARLGYNVARPATTDKNIELYEWTVRLIFLNLNFQKIKI